LPRSGGVEAEDDLLCLWVEDLASPFDADRFKAGLSARLPEGLELLSVRVVAAKKSFQAGAATYVLPVRQDCLDEKLKIRIKHLLASESLNLQRRINAKGNVRSVDVRPFLKSIEFYGKGIIVECKISSAGTIRVEEILKLLELDTEKLAAPIRRTSVKWQVGES